MKNIGENKFFILLKKEIKELLTINMILPLIITVLIFVLIGKIMSSETKKAQNKKISTYIIFEKDSQSSSYEPLKKELLSFLEKANVVFFVKEAENIDFLKDFQYAKEHKLDTILFIKKGYFNFIISKNIEDIQFEIYNVLKSIGGISFGRSSGGSLINILKTFNKMIYTNLFPDEKYKFYENPVSYNEFVIFNGKVTKGNLEMIIGFLYLQNLLVPIIVYMLIIMSSQMVAVAIASEKENKTLETLLSIPIRRSDIATSKMIAGAIVSLFMALIYIIGFNSYMRGVTGMNTSSLSEASKQMSIILKNIDFNLKFIDYLLVALSIFTAILNVLAISLILGLFAEDVKKVQTVITPIMFLSLIPYFLSIFLNINELPIVVKLIIYAIPFAHPFFVINSLLLKDYLLVGAGIIYQFIVFMIFIFLTNKIFQSDKILTMKIKMGEKKKVFNIDN
ncbi:MAG: ABC transporter permease [Spirochaetes bacterium]|nr:ABC transporter permease [Spirochaetota bacterium]